MSEFIQFHILTSYPPANLNRDDLGRPKTAMFGGTQRLRVSSQSLKRAWRTSDVFASALKIGIRTKDIGNYVFNQLREKNAGKEVAVAEVVADEIAKRVAAVFGKSKAKSDEAGTAPEAEKAVPKPGLGKSGGKPGGKAAAPTEGNQTTADGRKTEQLAHISLTEKAAIDDLVKRIRSKETVADDDYQALLSNGHGTPDIALFGRMLAASPKHNVEAAAQVAHAISVHRVTVEDDYFTAVDDLNDGSEDVGAGHVGTSEFAAAVFYHYVCVNRTLLIESLDKQTALADETIKALLTACCTVAPSGKQNSFGSHARASFLLAEKGSQQPRSLSVAFLRSVEGPDILGSAIGALAETRAAMDEVYGKCADVVATFNAHGVKGEGSLQAVLKRLGLEQANNA